jgi:hypothetical protein
MRETPLVIGQRVLIQLCHRHCKRCELKRPFLGVVKDVSGQAPSKAWIYFVRQDDGGIGTYSDRQVTPITALDELATV